jgi:hypothetical protein
MTYIRQSIQVGDFSIIFKATGVLDAAYILVGDLINYALPPDTRACIVSIDVK